VPRGKGKGSLRNRKIKKTRYKSKKAAVGRISTKRQRQQGWEPR